MVWDVPDCLWERNFAAAVEFHRRSGHLEVPADYVDKNGVRLGAWICNVRRGIREGNSGTRLTAEQIRRLDELGMNWKGRHNATWDRSYEAACRSKAEHGDLEIPVAYKTQDGIALGRWIRRQKTAKLKAERKEKLEAISMTWEKADPWIEKFSLVSAYYDQHGHTKMPADLVVNRVWVRRWLTEQTARLNERPTGRNKTVKKLTAAQMQCLQSVGILPDSKPLAVRLHENTQTDQRSTA